ncbi:hypothetical protein GOV04_04435 [Candidatus Woesearchaeota archaeon]|nr:hypothetical protein [Candidatus Woesearchaeota archaeon]
MKLELVKQTKLPLLSRERVVFWLNNTGPTPSRAQLREAVAKQLSVKEEVVMIRHVYPQYGNPKIKIIAHVYKKASDAIIEGKAMVKKHEKKAEEPKEVAPAEVETPAEEKKEEAEKTEEPAKEKKEDKSE